MSNKDFLSDQASLFYKQLPADLLVDGWLGCSGVGDLTLPASDRTPVYCPDPAQRGKWRIKRTIPGEPGFATFTLEKPLSDVNFLLSLQGQVDYWLAYAERGDRTDPTNYDVGYWLLNGEATQRGISPAKTRAPGDNAPVLTTAQVSALAWLEVRKVTAARQTITEANAINGLAFLDFLDGVRLAGKYGYAGCDAAGAATARVLKTVDGGSTWTACAADPFAADEHVGKPLLCELPATGLGRHRVIIPRIVTDAGSPAEIAYSDTAGAAWSAVSFGSNGDYVTAFYRLDDGFLVAGLDGGGLYASRDKGLSWSAWTSGVSVQINGISFYDRKRGFVVGAGNTFLRSVDGGGNWESVTGPIAATALNAVWAVSEHLVFVAAADGKLYRSGDAGDNWAEVAFSGSGSGSVVTVAFDPSHGYVGHLIHSPAAGADKLFRSFDQGVTWDEVGLPGANTGLNDLFLADPNTLWAVGEPETGTGYIAKLA